MLEDKERVYARIDLDAIRQNMMNMHAVLPQNTRMMAVIKTDGYGYGALPIAEMLEQLGIKHHTLEFSLNLQKNKEALEQLKPDFVFNLVESVNNSGNLIFLAPALLNSMQIPFTGGSLETIFLTSSKTLCKQRMKERGIPTAYWYEGKGTFTPEKSKQ